MGNEPYDCAKTRPWIYVAHACTRKVQALPAISGGDREALLDPTSTSPDCLHTQVPGPVRTCLKKKINKKHSCFGLPACQNPESMPT